MARALTTEQKQLLRSPDLHVNALITCFLDEGTYRFCDDIGGFDLFDGTYTYLGANTLTEASEIRAGADLAAEQVTLTLDGNRMAQAGIADPGRVLRDILGYVYQQRRIDYAFGFRYSYSRDINLVIPAYAGKINSARLIDEGIDFSTGDDNEARCVTKLEIVLDSLAARYRRASNRVRSHEDQLEIDPTDNFYSFTKDVAMNERVIYWGKDAPYRSYGGSYGAGGGGSGGGLSGTGSLFSRF